MYKHDIVCGLKVDRIGSPESRIAKLSVDDHHFKPTTELDCVALLRN